MIKRANKYDAKPFLKWAGGKHKLLKEIRKYYPIECTKYCEPFIGGGAVMLDLLNNYELDNVLVIDYNQDLINTYIAVRDNIDDLADLLYIIQNDYLARNDTDRAKMYYEMRDEFNKNNIFNISKAACFIFLNHTCYNGLYRVNSNGYFNSPMGKYKNPKICDEDNLREVNKVIQSVDFQCCDYHNIEPFVDDSTFIYFDPPYYQLTDTMGFTSYTKDKFDVRDHINVRDFADKLTLKKAHIILSNSDPHNVDINNNFIDDLYQRYEIKRVDSRHVLGRKVSSRKAIKEVLINNYKLI